MYRASCFFCRSIWVKKRSTKLGGGISGFLTRKKKEKGVICECAACRPILFLVASQAQNISCQIQQKWNQMPRLPLFTLRWVWSITGLCAFLIPSSTPLFPVLASKPKPFHPSPSCPQARFCFFFHLCCLFRTQGVKHRRIIILGGETYTARM